MLLAINSRLRRHRQLILAAVALVASALALVAVHRVLMDASAAHHSVDGTVTACIVVAGALAVAGGALFALRRPALRPRWRLVVPRPAPPAVVPAGRRPAVRAGPSRAGLQVFRL